MRIYQTRFAVMAAALTGAACFESFHQMSFTLSRGIHSGIPGDLSMFVYKLLPALTVPNAREETITGSVPSDYITTQRPAWLGP